MERTRVLDHPVERPLTLREKIVEFIKDAIINGKLQPGERVPEHDIADSFGISRTPIREAFRQLESEGFITVVPRKGAVVSSITPQDVSDFYAIKSLLEGYAARQACIKFTAKDVKKLETLNAQMQRSAQKGDVKGFFKLDNQFHDTFLALCGNEKLLQILHQMVEQFERLRIAALSLPERMARSIKQHEEIIAAFSAKDVELIEKLVRENAEFSAQVLAEKLAEKLAKSKESEEKI